MKSKRKKSDYMPLVKEIQAGQVYSLYLLFGEDSWLLEDLVERLRKILISPETAALDYREIDGTEPGALNLDSLQQEVRTPPFFSKRRMVVVKRSGWFKVGGMSPDRQQHFLELVDTLPDSVCLVFVEEKVDKRQKKLVQGLQKRGLLAEVLHEDPVVLTGWIRRVLAQKKVQIDAATAENLIDRCAADMRVLRSELSKISDFCAATGTPVVDLPLLDELSLPDLRGSIFNITDAISAGKTAEALCLFQILLDRREPVQLLLFMIARHFKQLILAWDCRSADELASTAGVLPFVAKRLQRQVGRFSLAKLYALYEACFETDAAIKSGRIDEITGLEIILAQAGRAARLH